MTRTTATEAARRLSDLVTRVSAGEEIELTRAGAPVAVISPARTRALTAGGFREVMAAAPSVDEGFLEEVRAARDELGGPPGAVAVLIDTATPGRWSGSAAFG